MRRKKAPTGPTWLIWDGDDFPREIHSDSIVFYANEHVDLDVDDIARLALAKTIQTEGISESLGEAFKLIESAIISMAGYTESSEDKFLYVYCNINDDNLEYDATFVEVAYVN